MDTHEIRKVIILKFSLDSIRLKEWFCAEKRDLPWRQLKDPYAIWVSEIMLQQTQVAVVIPYFLKWMSLFPSIAHLAAASTDEVIKAWEGLGYYSRARNLHEAAKDVVVRFGGFLPAREEELKEIKGLGPYTVGAILSFAFHQKKAAVDGNVMRVLTRYFALEDDIAKSSTAVKLRRIAQELLPDEEPWVVNEALIELGATICQRKPRCHECPLKKSCQGLQKGIADRLPMNSKKTAIEHLHRSVAVVQAGSSYLVSRGRKGAVMSDLYEFPYFDITPQAFSPVELKKKMKHHYSLQIVQKKLLPEVTHGYTRYHVRLYPVLFQTDDPKEIDGFDWIPHEALQKLAFSSGHRRIFHQLSDLSV